MKKTTLTAILATAFSLAAFENVQAAGLFEDVANTATGEASDCGPDGCKGSNNPGSTNTNPGAAGESTKINTTTSNTQQ